MTGCQSEIKRLLILTVILVFRIADNGANAADSASNISDAGPSVVARLLETGSVNCQPALRYFCENVHVGCAGRSKMKTFPFVLYAKSKQGWIKPAGRSGIDEYSAKSMLITDAGNNYVILRSSSGNGYLKLQSGGDFSFRYYNRGSGVMSYGKCR